MDQQTVKTASEIARDFRVGRATVIGLIKHGEFPNAFKAGKLWRIPCADLSAYIQRNKVKMGITRSSLSSGSASVNNVGGALTVI
jgi:excisionase family DNA binding protein